MYLTLMALDYPNGACQPRGLKEVEFGLTPLTVCMAGWPRVMALNRNGSSRAQIHTRLGNSRVMLPFSLRRWLRQTRVQNDKYPR